MSMSPAQHTTHRTALTDGGFHVKQGCNQCEFSVGQKSYGLSQDTHEITKHTSTSHAGETLAPQQFGNLPPGIPAPPRRTREQVLTEIRDGRED